MNARFRFSCGLLLWLSASKQNCRSLPGAGIADDAFLNTDHFQPLRSEFNQKVITRAIRIEVFPIVLETLCLFSRVVYQPGDAGDRNVRLILADEIIESDPWLTPDLLHLATSRVGPQPNLHIVFRRK